MNKVKNFFLITILLMGLMAPFGQLYSYAEEQVSSSDISSSGESSQNESTTGSSNNTTVSDSTSKTEESTSDTISSSEESSQNKITADSSNNSLSDSSSKIDETASDSEFSNEKSNQSDEPSSFNEENIHENKEQDSLTVPSNEENTDTMSHNDSVSRINSENVDCFYESSVVELSPNKVKVTFRIIVQPWYMYGMEVRSVDFWIEGAGCEFSFPGQMHIRSPHGSVWENIYGNPTDCNASHCGWNFAENSIGASFVASVEMPKPKTNRLKNYSVKIQVKVRNVKTNSQLNLVKDFGRLFKDEDLGFVTVNYVDTLGNKLAAPETLSGIVGTNYSTKPKEISGYTLKETQGDATGTFQTNPRTVTYVYTPVDPTGKVSFLVDAIDTETNTMKVAIKNELNRQVTFDRFFIENSIPFMAKINSCTIDSPDLELKVQNIGNNAAQLSPVDQGKNILEPNATYVLTIKFDSYTPPTQEYKTKFSLLCENVIVNEQTQNNYFGLVKEPDSFVEVPKSIDFTNDKKEEEVGIRLLGKNGQAYTGNNSVQVTAVSANNFNLKDSLTNKSIPYSVTYSNKKLSSTNSEIGTLSKDHSTIDGSAKLLGSDFTGTKYNYVDTITYEFNYTL